MQCVILDCEQDWEENAIKDLIEMIGKISIFLNVCQVIFY